MSKGPSNAEIRARSGQTTKTGFKKASEIVKPAGYHHNVQGDADMETKDDVKKDGATKNEKSTNDAKRFAAGLSRAMRNNTK